MVNEKSCFYQLDFRTPGISPLLASSLKQIRHKPNIRMYPCVRPQRQHRLMVRLVNLGFLFALTIKAVRAITSNY
jgi:hypothetical protein